MAKKGIITHKVCPFEHSFCLVHTNSIGVFFGSSNQWDHKEFILINLYLCHAIQSPHFSKFINQKSKDYYHSFIPKSALPSAQLKLNFLLVVNIPPTPSPSRQYHQRTCQLMPHELATSINVSINIAFMTHDSVSCHLVPSWVHYFIIDILIPPS